MKRAATILLLVSSLLVMPFISNCIVEQTKEMNNWVYKYRFSKPEKVTKLHFYFHDTLSAKNPTAFRVASASITDKTPTMFGLVNVIDDPLTLLPDPASKQIGRAQGHYASCGLDQVNVFMSMSFLFTSGEYNGSTLTVAGLNQAQLPVRELPIVAGTGAFRFARGLATIKAYSLNLTNFNAVVDTVHRIVKSDPKAVMLYLTQRVEQLGESCYAFLPYIQGNHWILLVVGLDEGIVYFVDPLNNPLPDVLAIKASLNTAARYYWKKRSKKKAASLRYKQIRGPKQPGGDEYGYYVMTFIRAITEHHASGNEGLPQALEPTGQPYPKEEVDKTKKSVVEFLLSAL